MYDALEHGGDVVKAAIGSVGVLRCLHRCADGRWRCRGLPDLDAWCFDVFVGTVSLGVVMPLFGLRSPQPSTHVAVLSRTLPAGGVEASEESFMSPQSSIPLKDPASARDGAANVVGDIEPFVPRRKR